MREKIYRAIEVAGDNAEKELKGLEEGADIMC